MRGIIRAKYASFPSVIDSDPSYKDEGEGEGEGEAVACQSHGFDRDKARRQYETEVSRAGGGRSSPGAPPPRRPHV